jgi:hypothetical protein
MDHRARHFESRLIQLDLQHASGNGLILVEGRSGLIQSDTFDSQLWARPVMAGGTADAAVQRIRAGDRDTDVLGGV